MEPIRVLHILHSMNRGGAENALMNYYRHIDREKVQFDFMLTAQHETLFECEIRCLGGKIFRVSPLTMGNPFPYINDVISFFRGHPEYKIVHSHTSSKSAIPLSIAKLMGVPVRCCHSHSSSSEGGLHGHVRNFLMPILKMVSTDYLSCGNQAAEWLYGKKTFSEGKVLVFKNVIETDKFRYNDNTRQKLRHQYGFDAQTLVLGHTARFNAVKNHLFDLDVLLALKKRGEKVKLLLVGGGELENAIKEKAHSIGLGSDIIFTGIVPNVFDYEQAMDIFLLPSLYEGLPLSIIEAQVAGLPCFTTEGKVSKECSVTDLVTYLPLEAGAEYWAQKIIEVKSKQRTDRYREIRNAGYDAKTSAEKLQSFYIRRYNESI